MTPNRLEAFTDAVIAILITIMVLEIHVPEEPTLASLREQAPYLLAYVLSFVNLAGWWNNHHHLLRATKRIDGRVMWANMALLFWLSLFPFATAWIGNDHTASIPAAIYGVIALLAGAAFGLLENAIFQANPGSELQKATSNRTKEYGSLTLYSLGIGLAFVNPWLSYLCYATVIGWWTIPDRRMAAVLQD